MNFFLKISFKMIYSLFRDTCFSVTHSHVPKIINSTPNIHCNEKSCPNSQPTNAVLKKLHTNPNIVTLDASIVRSAQALKTGTSIETPIEMKIGYGEPDSPPILLHSIERVPRTPEQIIYI